MGCYFERLGKTSSDEVTTELRPGGWEEGSQADIFGKSIPGGGNSQGTDSEVVCQAIEGSQSLSRVENTGKRVRDEGGEEDGLDSIG